MKITNFSIVCVLALLVACQSEVFSQDVIIKEWNTRAVNMTLSATPLPAPAAQTRLMAIYSLAVHDAVNGITREYETYLPPPVAVPDGASEKAAAIAASYRALCGLFPSQCTALLPVFQQSLIDHGVTEADPGVNYGFQAAQAILDLRSTDGAAQAQFVVPQMNSAPPFTLPGAFQLLSGQLVNNVHQPLLPGWGNVTPFVLRSGSQFRPEAPPALDSEVYTRDYNEVKAIGRSQNACIPTQTGLGNCQTEEQAERMRIALFWRDGSPVRVWNQPLQVLATAAGLDISTSARTYALLHTAAADSSIACWEAKYGIPGVSGGYNAWRPRSAINRGAEDGNPLTDADPSWNSAHSTPTHPEYPSGHTTNSTAMATILALTFGDEPGTPIVSSVPAVGITRTWNSFTKAADEVIDARVYSGIHFRNTDEVGSRLGGQVAHFVYTHALRPCKGKGTCS